MSLTPPSQRVDEGDTVSVSVDLENVSNVGAWEIAIKYDPDILEFADYTSTSFLSATGRQAECPLAVEDESNGWVLIGCGTLGSGSGPSGSATVATARFTALSSGVSDLEIVKAEITDPRGSDDCCPPSKVNEAAVRVGDGDMPPTPTPNPRKLTPTVPAGAATRDPSSLLPTPGPTRGGGSQSTSNSSNNGTGGSTGTITGDSGTGGASGGEGGPGGLGSGVLSGSSSGSGSSGGSGSGASGGAAAGNDRSVFPVAGSGLRHDNDHNEYQRLAIVLAAFGLLFFVAVPVVRAKESRSR
jgi:hypothetical protein